VRWYGCPYNKQTIAPYSIVLFAVQFSFHPTSF